MSGLASCALALAATLAIESAVVAALVRGVRRRDALVAACWLNLVTQPLATLAVGYGAAGPWTAELCVTVLELCGYRVAARIAWPRAALVAIAANAASYAAGLLLERS